MQFHQKEDPNIFKILLVGPSGVGKTSLILKYIKGSFSYDYEVTVGVEFFTKTISINQKTQIKLQIWDTVGQQAFRSVVRSFYKGVSAILVLYSVDSKQSFIQLSSWMKQIHEYTHPETLIFLVGAKSDLQPIRKVTYEQGNNYNKSINGNAFMEVSAKTGQNVKELFEKLSKILVKKYNQNLSFKALVNPVCNTDSISKSQSFNLKYGGILTHKKTMNDQFYCC